MNWRSRGLAHWIAVALALVPVPFAVNDVIQLRLWEAEWWFLPFAVLFTLALSALIYGAVRGVFWLVGRLRH